VSEGPWRTSPSTPRSPRLYATIGRGGLHVSTDGGQTFTLVLPGRRGPIIARGPVIYLHGTRSIDSGATFRDFAPFDFVALVITYI
jgi:hypothetical protein